MPLKANIGLARKVSDNNYGSRGAAINLEIELDTALLQDSSKLQDKVRHVFGLVRTALEQELQAQESQPREYRVMSSNNGNDTTVNGHSESPRTSQPRIATTKQVKALRAIAHANNIDLGEYLHRIFRVDRPEHLTMKQASVAIDELKTMPSPVGAA